ncbi:MAG: hypothetical protein HZC55_26555 [Verrucomicrobia bacterium]|nr:hypothetical protein [Verrucomicrobiota bacterium]
MTTLHIDSLVALGAAGDFGLPLDTLLADLRRGRHRSLAQPQCEKALRDLADRSLAAPYESELGVARWRITARGRSALAEEGVG